MELKAPGSHNGYHSITRVRCLALRRLTLANRVHRPTDIDDMGYGDQRMVPLTLMVSTKFLIEWQPGVPPTVSVHLSPSDEYPP
jgi:hypothetical protein